MSETKLSRSIRQALNLKGYWVIRIQSGVIPIAGKSTRYVHCAEPGTPDLLLLTPELCFLEVKTPTGRLTPEQLRWHDRAASRGVPVRIVRSVSAALQVVAELACAPEASRSLPERETPLRAARDNSTTKRAS